MTPRCPKIYDHINFILIFKLYLYLRTEWFHVPCTTCACVLFQVRFVFAVQSRRGTGYVPVSPPASRRVYFGLFSYVHTRYCRTVPLVDILRLFAGACFVDYTYSTDARRQAEQIVRATENNSNRACMHPRQVYPTITSAFLNFQGNQKRGSGSK